MQLSNPYSTIEIMLFLLWATCVCHLVVKFMSLNEIYVRLSNLCRLLQDHYKQPSDIALSTLKNSFLARKDDEGVMLVEAVEKQLKKRRKAQPKPA